MFTFKLPQCDFLFILSYNNQIEQHYFFVNLNNILSLKNIGELGKYASSLENVDSYVALLQSETASTEQIIAFQNLRDSLEDLKIDDAVKKIQDLRLDPNLSKEILTAAQDSKLLKGSTEEIMEEIKNFESAPSFMNNIGNSVVDLGNTFIKLKNSVKSGLSSILSFAKANPYVTIAAGVMAVFTAFMVASEAFIETYDEASQKAKESAKTYKETKNSVESLKSELVSTRNRLKELQELQDTGTITMVEEKELENLKTQNSELERELQLKEKLAEIQLQEANDDAINALGKTDTSVASMYDNKGNKYTQGSKVYDANVTSMTDADALENSMKKVEKFEGKIAGLKKKQKQSLSKKEQEDIQKEIDKYKNAITDLETDMNARAQTISEHLKNVSDKTSAVYIENSKTLNKYLIKDLPETEKQLLSINAFFDGSSSNAIKDKLLETVKSGDSATDALHEMGITLDDLGITGKNKKKIFDDYFNDMVASAYQAEEALNSVDGSIEGVKAAFESDNQDASWNAMADYLKQAQTLYEEGKVGTDDFKTATQFITPNIINTDSFQYGADAYVEAWQNAQEKIKRYFDSENPFQSITNFSNDLVSNGLASRVGDNLVWSFKSSAEAAKALNLSIEATESLMHNLESYGAEFNEVLWSGEALERYKSSVEGLQNVYASLKDDSKKELKSLINFESLDRELEHYEKNISSLTEDQVIKIEFVYDLATIKSEIDALLKEISSTGGSTEQWGTLNAKQKTYNEKLASSENATGAVESMGYQESEEKLAELSQRLRDDYKVLGEEGRREIQMQQNAILELQGAYLEAFSSGTTVDWNEFLNSDAATDTLDSIKETTGLTIKDIQQLLDINSETVSKIEFPDFTKQSSDLNTTITFDADVEGVQTSIERITNPDGTVSFYANINGVQTELTPILNANGSINYKIKSQEAPKDKKAGLWYTIKGVLGNIGSFFSGGSQLNGTAHANGTLNSNTLNNRWKTKKNETALTGELGQEIVVHGNRWWTVGNRGAEFSYIPKGSVVFNAKQTRELLSKGFTNSRGRAMLDGTAYTNGSTDSTETFNWIETALSRIQRTITNFGKSISATWKSWGTRNSDLAKQISAVNKELDLQNQAKAKYTSLANSVGLSEAYKRLVRDGAIDISTITDENLAEQIKQYQEWYEKMLECDDAILDLKDELASLAQTNFDNITKQFEDKLSLIDHELGMLESTADLLETQGYIRSASIYDSLVQYEQENLNNLESKYTSLLDALNNSGIEKGTEQWNDMYIEVLGVKEEMLESQKALAEYNNTLQELEWEVFDKLQEKISGIRDESDFLIDLMSNDKLFDEKGNITEQGQATLGLHAMNYNTYMAQAEEYAKELEQINADLANDPYNQTLLERRDELLEQQREMIQAAEDEKESAIDLASEGYDTLLEYMDQLIEKRKDMLSQAKDLYDYEKNIAEQTTEVARLEKQLAAYQGDDSEESRATIQKLKVSLEEARENLEETEYDKYISDQEQMLDSLYSEAEEWINTRLDNEDLLLQNIIDSAKTNSESIMETLKTVTDEVGTTLSDKMEAIWSASGSVGSAITMMKDYIIGMQKDAEEKIEEIQASTTPSTNSTPNTSSPSSAPTTNTTASSSTTSSSWGSFFIKKTDSYPKGKLNINTSIVDRLKYNDIDSSFSARSQYYNAMGGSGVYTGSSSQNQWMLAQMKNHSGFARGGIIGSMIRSAGEDGIALVRRGEGIIPTNMMPEWQAMTQNLPQLNRAINLAASSAPSHISIDIGDIQMYGVNDPTEFAQQLKNTMLNNHSIRKIMKDTTLGEALGKNSMIRYTR